MGFGWGGCVRVLKAGFGARWWRRRRRRRCMWRMRRMRQSWSRWRLGTQGHGAARVVEQQPSLPRIEQTPIFCDEINPRPGTAVGHRIDAHATVKKAPSRASGLGIADSNGAAVAGMNADLQQGEAMRFLGKLMTMGGGGRRDRWHAPACRIAQ